MRRFRAHKLAFFDIFDKMWQLGKTDYILPIKEKWPHRLTVRTPAFHAGNRGSIPRGVTSAEKALSQESAFSARDPTSKPDGSWFAWESKTLSSIL